MSAPRFYVQIDRADGSRTYKGPWDQAHSQREADAWIDSFPSYGVRLVSAGDPVIRADVRAWTKATHPGRGIKPSRHYPPLTTSQTMR